MLEKYKVLRTAEKLNLNGFLFEIDREWMLPLARKFVQEVDLKKKSIQVQLPPGRLDLSAPVAKMPGKRKRRRARRTGNRG